jgi:hypothetical protein
MGHDNNLLLGQMMPLHWVSGLQKETADPAEGLAAIEALGAG